VYKFKSESKYAMLPKQYTLSTVLDLWRESKKTQKNYINQEKYLELALRLYVLPKINPQLKPIPKSDFYTYCNSLTVECLKDALTIFDSEFQIAVEQGITAKSTGKNYRAALKQFSLWLEQQPWWQVVSSISVAKVTPKREKLTPMPKKKKKDSSYYSLNKNDMPNSVRQELKDFQEFRLKGGLNLPRTLHQSNLEERSFVRRPKIDSVKPSVIQKEEVMILCFLGWYTKTFPNDKLELSLLIDINLLDDFIYWTVDHRGIGYSMDINTINVSISIAKWLNYNQAKRRNWSDIPVIIQLKNIRNEYTREYQKDKKISNIQKWEKKELSHEQARELVDYLKTLCAERTPLKDSVKGGHNQTSKRNLSAICRAWQTYLLIKILVYCPIRQEEIRNWVFDKTLFRRVDKQGQPYYIVKLSEHKLDRIGKHRHYPLPSILTEDLDIWLFTQRPMIENHLQTIEEWMNFWGYPSNIIERYQLKIENAKKGIFDPRVKIRSAEVYIKEQEKRIKGVQCRLSYLSLAKKNFETYNCVFFSFGKEDVRAFGQPFSITVFWEIIRRATAIATHALYGEAKWVNPHAFRHIGEKHLRLLGKAHLADAFGALIGHSKEMGDEYAHQILSEYEITKDIVNNWWLDDFN
jgi:hypothetical protein